jgi:hypothetical protein
MNSNQCKIVILSNILSNIQNYDETLQIIQVASKICKISKQNRRVIISFIFIFTQYPLICVEI